MNPRMRVSGSVIASTLLFVTACDSDEEARIRELKSAVAVGAYLPLDLSDACRGGGKVSICDYESVETIEQIQVSEPSVASVRRMDEITEALRTSSAKLVVEGKAPGSTNVAVDAIFDDGTHRSADTTIRVERANRMEVSHTCAVRDADARDLFPAQSDVFLMATLFHDDEPLLGEQIESLLVGTGIKRHSGGLERNSYQWTLPNAATTTTLESPIIRGYSETFRTYLPEQLTVTSIASLWDLSKPRQHNTYFPLTVELNVDGKRPCEVPPMRLESLTPEICAGRDSEVVWSEKPSDTVSVRALKSGTCKIVAQVEGTEKSHSISVEINVEASSASNDDPCEKVSCPNQVSECPAGQELVTRSCCNECAPQPEPSLCEAERATWDEYYRTSLEGTNHCVLDSDCATTVLIGGCRRYCHVLMYNQAIAPLMMKIAESYYTSCPHCVVDDPAPCEPRPNVRCEAGQCQFVK